MIFQSLGSNYSFKDALTMLFARGTDHDSEVLIHHLEKQFGGTAILYDKGRNALSAALTGIGTSTVAINGTTCSVVVDAADAAVAKIIYLDVERNGHFTADTLQKALDAGAKPNAVVIQNTYGQPSDIVAIEAIAEKHDITLIEDVAHSLGQTYHDGRAVGTVGDIVMLSFGRDKIIDVVNGGALIVREPKFLKAIPRPSRQRDKKAELRDHIYPILTWKARKLYRIMIGKLIVAGMYKFHLAEHSADGVIDTAQKMPNWQAKQLLGKLQHLDREIAHRKAVQAVYASLLPDMILADDAVIRTPIWVNDRQKILQALTSHGIYLSDTWYDTPIGPKRKFKKMNYPNHTCPNAVALSEHIINLPTHREVTPEIAARIAHIVKEAA